MIWSADPILLRFGPLEIRWYGLLFALAFIAVTEVTRYFYRQEGKPEADVSKLFTYEFFGTLVGARLGHCLFYEPDIYLRDPIRILRIWEGGLASHGAVIGILIAMYLFQRSRPTQPFLWLLDRLGIGCCLGAALIRMGNFFNSEILGAPTDLPWGVVFARIDSFARHPAQLYESLAYLVCFFALISVYRRLRTTPGPGWYAGWVMILVFGFRFFVEFVKEDQVAHEADLLINTGQILSIPVVLCGIYLVLTARHRERSTYRK